jgi:hypothetical protein
VISTVSGLGEIRSGASPRFRRHRPDSRSHFSRPANTNHASLRGGAVGRDDVRWRADGGRRGPGRGAGSFGRAEPGEPETGANVFRLPPTLRDVPGLFAQAGDSPSDSIRPRPTYRIRMACKRSGVRIPVAPPRSNI